MIAEVTAVLAAAVAVVEVAVAVAVFQMLLGEIYFLFLNMCRDLLYQSKPQGNFLI